MPTRIQKFVKKIDMATLQPHELYEKFYENLNDFERKYAPKLLFMSGNISLLTQGRRVSVVGSRKASLEGLRRAAKVTEELVKQGIIVVSGLAEGIDTVAHQTAMENHGSTIAVLGTPLNKAFPEFNKWMLEEIKRNHLAISQFPEGSKIWPKNFIIRNRTMALISDATIIIEAAEDSGTRHQGWEAIRLGRQVYILSNVLRNPRIKWAKEMLDYGAMELTNESLTDILMEIPSLTSELEIAF